MSTDVIATALQSFNHVMLFVLGLGGWKEPLEKKDEHIDAEPELRHSFGCLISLPLHWGI